MELLNVISFLVHDIVGLSFLGKLNFEADIQHVFPGQAES